MKARSWLSRSAVIGVLAGVVALGPGRAAADQMEVPVDPTAPARVGFDVRVIKPADDDGRHLRLTIQRTIEKVAAGNPATVNEVRNAFDRQKEIEYSISSIGSKDLQITKENDKVVISYAYNKEVPLFGPVYILLKYEGRSR